MKRTMALILSLTLAISGISLIPINAAATKVSEEARALEIIGMLEGDGGGVTGEYMTKRMTRFTAAISILKLKGLYNDALNYKKTENFKDINTVKWEEGKRVLAYLKANPDIGFIGNEKGEFLPNKDISEQEYFKVLLETLGFKQRVKGRSGDFNWSDTLDFAKTKGLKPSYKADFNIELLARATVSALKSKTKAGKVYIDVLVDSGKVKKSKAISAGFIKEEFNASLKAVKAIGNTVVQVEFKEDIDEYEAEYTGNYSIDGLTVKDALYIGDKTVRLTTSSQNSGKLYTLKVGNTKIKFTGISKISGAPNIKTIRSEDEESVIVEFDKELDYYSAGNPDNYYIADVDIEEAVISGKKVILTTYGLTTRKQYTLKVTNIKSIDGTVLKSQSKSFTNRPDTTPPNVREVIAETNERVVVVFSEGVSKDTAEDLYNYTITGTGKNDDLDIYEAILFGDDEDRVELVTEPQKANAKYEITIENIADKTKAGNLMTKAIKKTFLGIREDNTAPVLSKSDIKVISRNRIQLAFTDSSRIDEDTILDAGNYELIKNDRWKDEIYVDNVEKISFENGKYKVVLEVEDLEINMSYTLKVNNISDEFGNVLEKNNTATISVVKDDLAAAKIKSINVLKLDEIEIVFTKPLYKDSAEDIYNYYINNNIGYPSKAVYKDEKVILSTAKMTESKIYRLNIDGVEDESDNILRLYYDFKAITDTDAPVIKDITQISNKTFRVTMSKEAVIRKSHVESSPYAIFAVEYTNDKNIVTFTITAGYIDGKTDYKIDISNVLEDKNGIKAENKSKDYTIFYSDSKDYDKPFIKGVKALDAYTVEIEYNEDMGSSGKYSIKNTDPYAYNNTIGNTLKKIDKNKVILSLYYSLEHKYRYTLTIEEQGKDLAGNLSLDVKGDKFYFDGYDSNSISLMEFKEAEASVIKLESSVVNLNNTEQINSAKSQLDSANKKTTLVSDINLRNSLINRITISGSKIQIAEDKLTANNVTNKIDLLPRTSYITLEHKSIVESVRKAYNDLTKAQKNLVTNYNKLIEAEAKIAQLIMEEINKEQEKKDKEAEEAARLKAIKETVEALESIADNASNKIAAFLGKVEEVNLALSAYTTSVAPIELLNGTVESNTPEIAEKNAIDAISSAATLAKDLDLFMETLPSKISAAEGAAKDIENTEEKTILSNRIEIAKAKIESKKKAVTEAKEKIEDAKVEMAKKWLSINMLSFSKVDKADSDVPIILPLGNHKAGASFYYKEIGNMVDGRFIKVRDRLPKYPGASLKPEMHIGGLQFIDEIKEDKTIRSVQVNRGSEIIAVTIKVEIINDKKISYTLFNITIPPKSAEPAVGNVPVTIAEVLEKENVEHKKGFRF